MNSKQSAVNRKFSIIIFICLLLSGCTSTAVSPINFFQKYISQADGNRCPMYPTCSAYALEAIKKHGAVKGWIMTCDRLMRCGRDELTRCEIIEINGQHYCHDPVSNNDFW